MIKILTIIFSIILVSLIGRLWIGSGSFPQIWYMQDQINTLSTSNQQNQEENRKLEAEIHEFQNGTEAIEARARNDFGMTRKGETFYQVILEDKTSTVAPTELTKEETAVADHSINSTQVEEKRNE